MTLKAQRTVLSLSLSLAAVFSAQAAAADCDERVYDLLKAAYPGAADETGDNGEFLRTAGKNARWIKADEVACRVWPASPDKTLLAVRLRHEAADNDTETADLEVLVADSKQPRILQRYREDEALQSDAIRISALTLDTARYRLNETTTAFGVRVEYSGSSRANPYGSTQLNLYVADGDTLRPVLRKLEVALDRGEWDTNCAGEFETVKRTVAIDAKRDRGYAGLRVASVEEARRNVAKGEDCADLPVSKHQRVARLAFDGREYTVPADLRGL
ncbi:MULTISPECIES: hypothetical protein [unclassified Lysobacter]|uniref:hypothetical protein n=1 Tax=unclassified Lysobacter TaxID=2635362 RepID=UPI001BEBB77D|nr:MULTISPECIES: hypothetical protein [unclassified Lysobacter]MBT2747941.1 hypothetical protein [Lysobacter sp. ISL-42]MBT2753719.1 hypothetical protein [Lysobacter sp. ISL-50]MBT2779216.1 hypothetical protein [Lysobacter sp. ISL-54]